jgi:hypothetical protein
VELLKQLDDGLLRFGDALQLCSSTGGALAACLYERVGAPDANACLAALSPSEAPVVRASLSLEKCVARARVRWLPPCFCSALQRSALCVHLPRGGQP